MKSTTEATISFGPFVRRLTDELTSVNVASGRTLGETICTLDFPRLTEAFRASNRSGLIMIRNGAILRDADVIVNANDVIRIEAPISGG